MKNKVHGLLIIILAAGLLGLSSPIMPVMAQSTWHSHIDFTSSSYGWVTGGFWSFGWDWASRAMGEWVSGSGWLSTTSAMDRAVSISKTFDSATITQISMDFSYSPSAYAYGVSIFTGSGTPLAGNTTGLIVSSVPSNPLVWSGSATMSNIGLMAWPFDGSGTPDGSAAIISVDIYGTGTMPSQLPTSIPSATPTNTPIATLTSTPTNAPTNTLTPIPPTNTPGGVATLPPIISTVIMITGVAPVIPTNRPSGIYGGVGGYTAPTAPPIANTSYGGFGFTMADEMNMANGAITAYQTANGGGAINLLMWLFIAFGGIGLLFTLIKKVGNR